MIIGQRLKDYIQLIISKVQARTSRLRAGATGPRNTHTRTHRALARRAISSSPRLEIQLYMRRMPKNITKVHVWWGVGRPSEPAIT